MRLEKEEDILNSSSSKEAVKMLEAKVSNMADIAFPVLQHRYPTISTHLTDYDTRIMESGFNLAVFAQKLHSDAIEILESGSTYGTEDNSYKKNPTEMFASKAEEFADSISTGYSNFISQFNQQKDASFAESNYLKLKEIIPMMFTYKSDALNTLEDFQETEKLHFLITQELSQADSQQAKEFEKYQKEVSKFFRIHIIGAYS